MFSGTNHGRTSVVYRLGPLLAAAAGILRCFHPEKQKRKEEEEEKQDAKEVFSIVWMSQQGADQQVLLPQVDCSMRVDRSTGGRRDGIRCRGSLDGLEQLLGSGDASTDCKWHEMRT